MACSSRVAGIVETAGGRLLGPSPELIALAAEKQRTAEHLATARSAGRLLEKPSTPDDLLHSCRGNRLPGGVQAARRRRIERRAAARRPRCGGAVSNDVYQARPLGTILSGHRRERRRALRADGHCSRCPLADNDLSDDGRFRYLGGSCPLEPALDRRARSLAIQTIRSLTGPLGYVGIDLILGDDPDGQNDVVIEINPRLTTSYVGLRAIADGNLAAAMLAAAEGRSTGAFLQRPHRRIR